jgi:hypothetical protein
MNDATAQLGQPIGTTVLRLTERNLKAEKIITDYAKKHAGMDILIGIVGLVPGAPIPAIVGAVAAQGPLIYRPMASDLAAVYTVDCDALNEGIEDIKRLVNVEWVHTGVLDIASEFGQEFMMQIAHELVMEAGAGILASLCVPVLGGVVGAALDYLFANIMTWRVGTMVSMYYQNNAQWLGDRQATFERAKQLTGGIRPGILGILRQTKERLHLDLNTLRDQIPEIAEAQVRALRPVADMMRSTMGAEQIGTALRGQGIPADLVHEALQPVGRTASISTAT